MIVRFRSHALAAAVIAATCMAMVPATAQARKPQPPAPACLFNDSHFHLTNYVQKGLTVRQYVDMMGTTVKRSTLIFVRSGVTSWFFVSWTRCAPRTRNCCGTSVGPSRVMMNDEVSGSMIDDTRS